MQKSREYDNLTLLEKVKAPQERLWYAEQTIVDAWSRNVLSKPAFTGRQGKAVMPTIAEIEAELANPESTSK